MKSPLLYIALFICSCSSKVDEMKKVYNDRDGIINLFSSKSVIRSRGQNIILFYTHKNDKTNKYFFGIDSSNQYQFMNDSIEYRPDILQLKNEIGSEMYKQELISNLKIVLGKMDELNIRDVSSDWSGVGIDLKIYMKSQGVVLFVSNPQNIKAPRFSDYINAMRKFDNNWFYATSDH